MSGGSERVLVQPSFAVRLLSRTCHTTCHHTCRTTCHACHPTCAVAVEQALGVAHALPGQGVHGDMRPPNILVRSAGGSWQVMFVDFEVSEGVRLGQASD